VAGRVGSTLRGKYLGIFRLRPHRRGDGRQDRAAMGLKILGVGAAAGRGRSGARRRLRGRRPARRISSRRSERPPHCTCGWWTPTRNIVTEAADLRPHEADGNICEHQPRAARRAPARWSRRLKAVSAGEGGGGCLRGGARARPASIRCSPWTTVVCTRTWATSRAKRGRSMMQVRRHLRATSTPSPRKPSTWSTRKHSIRSRRRPRPIRKSRSAPSPRHLEGFLVVGAVMRGHRLGARCRTHDHTRSLHAFSWIAAACRRTMKRGCRRPSGSPGTASFA